ncbi:MAG: dihydropteroate synthase [Alistipes inops]
MVMLFDERGQADVYERKIEVAARAYRLLTAAGFPPEDIVFDPNVLAVATGIPEHDVYARDFIRATEWIRANLPGVNVSGGISNLSFAFRGVTVYAGPCPFPFTAGGLISASSIRPRRTTKR